MTYDVRNPGIGLGQAQKGGEVKPTNRILIRLTNYCPLKLITKMNDTRNINSNRVNESS